MQALPDLMRFASSMATIAGLVNEDCTIMSKRRWQAQRPDMLYNLGSPMSLVLGHMLSSYSMQEMSGCISTGIRFAAITAELHLISWWTICSRIDQRAP